MLGLKPKVVAPAYPLRDFSDAELAFGARQKDYLTPEELGDWYGFMHETPYHKIVHKLFYEGGKVEDFGLTIKKGLDPEKVYRALQALLTSFGPKHEVKVGTVAIAIANWFEGTPNVEG